MWSAHVIFISSLGECMSVRTPFGGIDTVWPMLMALVDVAGEVGEKGRKTAKPKWMTPMNVQSVFRMKIVSAILQRSPAHYRVGFFSSVRRRFGFASVFSFPRLHGKAENLLLNRFIAIPALFMAMFFVHFLRRLSHEVNITPFYCLHNVHFEAFAWHSRPATSGSGRRHSGSESQAQCHSLRNYRASSLSARP